MATVMLCRGLNALDRATAQATADAVIRLIEDGRLNGETFGSAMQAFLKSRDLAPRRWPARIDDVANSSYAFGGGCRDSAFAIRRQR